MKINILVQKISTEHQHTYFDINVDIFENNKNKIIPICFDTNFNNDDYLNIIIDYSTTEIYLDELKNDHNYLYLNSMWIDRGYFEIYLNTTIQNNNISVKNIVFNRKSRKGIKYENIKNLYANYINEIIIHYDDFVDMYLIFGHYNMNKYDNVKMSHDEYLLLSNIFKNVDCNNFDIYEPHCGGFLDISFNKKTIMTLTIQDDNEFGYNYKLWINLS